MLITVFGKFNWQTYAPEFQGQKLTWICFFWQVHVQTLQSLAAATVLQKLCLFNCKLDQDAAEQLVACLEDGGFSNLQELDLTGNDIEAPQMQALLQTLLHGDRAPFLKVKCVRCLSCNKVQSL